MSAEPLSPPVHPACLTEEARKLARRYVWWQPADTTLARLPWFLAHAMNLALWEDQLWLEAHFSPEELREALELASAGTFTPQSWNYWHIRLGLPVPPLPKKMIPENII